MSDWNPELYLKFSEQRTRPALDLALRARSLLEEGASGGVAGTGHFQTLGRTHQGDATTPSL